MAAFTVIDHTELTGTTTSWAEASIPASYDHLLLEASIRGTQAAYFNNLWIRVGNGSLDTGANYSSTYLHASTASPVSGRATGQTKWAYQYIGSASTLADTFGTVKIWIPNYANTANFKQVIIETAMENNSTTNSQWYLAQVAGLWSSTSAITDIELSEPNAGMAQYSTFTLYGVSGA
jgi:hypothetical protein